MHLDPRGSAEGDRHPANRGLEVVAKTHHGDLEVEGIAGGGAELAADAQLQPSSHSRVLADLHGHRIPERPDRGVLDAPLHHLREEEGGVAGRAAPSVVRRVRDGDRALRGRCSLGEALHHRLDGGAHGVAQGEELAAHLLGDPGTPDRVVVRHHHHRRAEIGNVSIGEAVTEPDVEDSLLLFQCGELVHEAPQRLAGGGEEPDHAAIEGRDDRLHLALGGIGEDREEVEHPVHDVDVGVLLVADQRRRLLDHPIRHVRVEIELRSHGNLGTNQLAHAGQDVALAVVAAVGHHGAVEHQQHAVHGQGCLQIREKLVAQLLVEGLRRRPRRLREGEEPLRHLPSALTPQLAQQRAGAPDRRRILLARIRAVNQHQVLPHVRPRRHRGEGVGLGGQHAQEHSLHRVFLPWFRRGAARRPACR